IAAAGQPAPAVTATETLSGEAVYTANCSACHAAGVAGAPKLGDAGAWSARIAQGNDVLYEHAVKGYQGSAGLMPAKGGNANLSDDEVKAAVDHMVASSK
ncbi:MAG: c-type cytochrome, partial [Gammaproteobacteria bacterium]|nr:c-type cytochrome [Gammaproteobacteria bacterium]